MNHSFRAHSTNIDQSILKKCKKTQTRSMRVMNMEKPVYMAHTILFVFVQKIDNFGSW